MPVVYILKGKRYYIGSSTCLKKRGAEHKRCHTFTTKRIGKWKLTWYKECETIEKARKIERKIKKWKNKTMIGFLIEGNIELK